MTSGPTRAAPRPVTPLGMLADTLAALGREVDADGMTDSARERLRGAGELAGGLEGYVAACTTTESPALRALAERTAAEDWGAGGLEQEMLSGHVEGQALKMLVHLGRARRVLDIGMFTGYSALAMAEALPADGVVVACERDPRAAAVAGECFAASEHGTKIDVRLAPATRTLAELAGGEPFDLVFLDADKPGYLGYLHQVLDGDLLTPHGVVCVDNTLLQGEPWSATPGPNGAAIAQFNAAVQQDPRVEQVLLPLRDGLTLLRRV